MRGSKQERDWELYNLAEDRSEMNNLATQNPEKAKELSAKWNEWNNRVGEDGN